MAAGWFYKNGEDELGPVTPNQIRVLVADGSITRITPLRKEDSANWMRAERIKGLFPEQTVEDLPDPLLAMGSQAAGAVVGAAGSAAKAVGTWFAKKPEKATAEPVDVESKIREKLAGILMSDEAVELIAIQSKPIANWMPDCICLTNKRFIFYKPKMLGRVDFEDYIWRDLRDAKVVENIIGATFMISVTDGTMLSMDYLPRDQAKAVYRFAQEKEQSVLEERRQRAMEEQRAKVGGVTVNMAHPAHTASAEDPVAKLQKLKQMADAGLITEAEYDAKKAEILSRM